MKRWLIVLTIICLLLVVSVYIFIPNTLIVSKVTTITSPLNVTNRFLLNKTSWYKWWPEKSSKPLSGSDTIFSYNNFSYHVTALFADKVDVTTTHIGDTVNTSITMLPMANNSVALKWEGSLNTGLNPFSRVSQYFKAVRIKNNMTSIIGSLAAFLENSSNVYGFPIKEIISKDSTLIAAKFLTSSYPTTAKIYSVIDSMKAYVASQGAVETDHPMLRVTKLNDSSYQTMVAIPTNKALSGNSEFFFLRFVPYKTLTGTVTGGLIVIDKAFRQMEVFVDDHQRSAMAVPFQSLVTDRSIETDSSKWVTIICQPVS